MVPGTAQGKSVMIDVMTQEPLTVEVYSDAEPCITLPVSQLEAVQSLLDAHQILYWTDEIAISLDGEPEVTVINLSRRSDPVLVQRLLDSVP